MRESAQKRRVRAGRSVLFGELVDDAFTDWAWSCGA